MKKLSFREDCFFFLNFENYQVFAVVIYFGLTSPVCFVCLFEEREYFSIGVYMQESVPLHKVGVYMQ